MTAKEEAKELVGRFNDHIEMVSDYIYELEFAKKRALICVKDKIEFIMELPISDFMKYDLVENEMRIQNEIEKL